MSFKKIDWKKFGMGILFVFLGFQALSLILGNFFMTFKTISVAYQTIWLWIILGLVVYLIFRLVYGIKSFDKRSIFILLLALGLIGFIVIYFGIDFGQLFNMALIKDNVGSIIASIIP